MHKHGGDIYGGDVRLDFSANLNFFGMPESVREAAYRGILNSEHYPDVECRELRRAISVHDGIPVEQIVCGNGAADLIFGLVLAKRPKLAVLAAPTFYEYEQALHMVDCQIRRVYLSEEEGFPYSERILEALTPEVDMIFLCHPNNPTGQLLEAELREKILARCEACDILLVLDECFTDFLDDEEREKYPWGCAERNYEHVAVLRAFTKIYAMAGLRLGYAIVPDENLRERLRLVRQPWSVSIPAQMAGAAALKEEAYVERFRGVLKEERAWLKGELEKLGITPIGSHANYIFFRSVEDLTERMRREGILIRDCANYEGLHAGYYRIAVRTREENTELIRALGKVLAQDRR